MQDLMQEYIKRYLDSDFMEFEPFLASLNESNAELILDYMFKELQES